MKLLLLLLTLVLSGCAGYNVSLGVFTEKEGRRSGASVTFEPTGKRVASTK